MMEESSDEQPEIVSREEAEEAEKEASAAVPEARIMSSTPIKAGSPGPVGVPAPPAPLPALFTSMGSTAFSQATSVSPLAQMPKPPLASSVTSPASMFVPTPSPVQTPPVQTYTAPEPMQTPVEASSATPINPDTPTLAQHPISPGVGGIFGWFSGSSLVSKMMEKTKSSVESVITTLDPGMKEVIYSGGNMNIIVTSAKENKVGVIREAFQKVFGHATVSGVESQATLAPQLVGFTSGLKGAEERIQKLRQTGDIDENQSIVSVEGFIVELLPDRWYDMSCLILQDPKHHVELQTFSQPTLIPAQYVLTAQDCTPSDYPLRWSGLAVTIGQVIEEAQPQINRSDWQGALAGVNRRESLFLAAKSLAYMYKQRLPAVTTS